MAQITRRTVLKLIGGGLAVGTGLTYLVSSQSLAYRVLDAYIDSDGEKVLQIYLDKDKSNRTFYEIIDYSHSRRYPNLSMSVW